MSLQMHSCRGLTLLNPVLFVIFSQLKSNSYKFFIVFKKILWTAILFILIHL